MVLAKEFKGFDIFADDAQLRLAQVYQVEAENIVNIKNRFKVSHLQEKNMSQREILGFLMRASKKGDNSPSKFYTHHNVIEGEVTQWFLDFILLFWGREGTKSEC